MEFAGFEWDRDNRKKCQKHGLSIAEIESVFDRTVRIAPDVKHSLTEERFKAIGTTAAGRNVIVAFTLRRRGDSTLLRPVSARYMHKKEVTYYEKETSNSQE